MANPVFCQYWRGFGVGAISSDTISVFLTESEQGMDLDMYDNSRSFVTENISLHLQRLLIVPCFSKYPAFWSDGRNLRTGFVTYPVFCLPPVD